MEHLSVEVKLGLPEVIEFTLYKSGQVKSKYNTIAGLGLKDGIERLFIEPVIELFIEGQLYGFFSVLNCFEKPEYMDVESVYSAMEKCAQEFNSELIDFYPDLVSYDFYAPYVIPEIDDLRQHIISVAF